MEPSFEALFQGAARLGMMSATRGLAWQRFTPFVESFSPELDGYQELSLTPGGGDLGLMTRGSGEGFTHRVARYMDLRGVPEARLRRLLVTARHFEHRNLFFKAELTPEGEEMSWYFRRRPRLEVALEWLAADGIGETDRGLTALVAGALGKKTVHFLGCSEAPKAATPSGSKLYFSQPTDAPWDELISAATITGLSDAEWAPLLARREELEGHTCFLSLDYADGRLKPGVKIDIHGAPVDAADALARVRASPHGLTLLKLFERARYDYIGVRLRPAQEPTVKVYCYRQGPL